MRYKRDNQQYSKEFITIIIWNQKETRKDTVTCEICSGLGVTSNTICSFCNGTRESTPASQGFIRHHICGCSTTNRKTCPWCRKPCHHDASLKPRILISGL